VKRGLWALVWLTAACSGAPLPADPPDPATVRCTDDGTAVKCLRQAFALPGRWVQWQVPQGDAPPAGWPAVLIFHGSFQGTGPIWESRMGDEWGAYWFARTTKALLERGYAVLTPESIHRGNWYWNTNVVGFADNWSIAPDADMMAHLLDAISSGSFGPLDSQRLYATGLSSGGYMTSRMAISYAGKFRALAVHSASYAKCAVQCSVPQLPSDHPPTLLLHGEQDQIVPIATMRVYEQQLRTQGLTVDTEVSSEAGHEWLEAAVARVPAWFDAHR
jgi:poly(3-hydroxybutyrate) depolymerase